MPARVVVVDDDEALRNAVRRALRLEGYDVATAADGSDALDQLGSRRADLVVLDVLMPVLDGITVRRRLRASGDSTPILMLTARDAVSDRVVGLDAGADDYLTKPFALEELLARVRALVRRNRPGTDASFAVADLELDPRTRLVTRGQRRIELTRTEFACGSCSCAMRRPCSPETRSESACGASTTPTGRTRSTCTSATCSQDRSKLASLGGVAEGSATSDLRMTLDEWARRDRVTRRVVGRMGGAADRWMVATKGVMGMTASLRRAIAGAVAASVFTFAGVGTGAADLNSLGPDDQVSGPSALTACPFGASADFAAAYDDAEVEAQVAVNPTNPDEIVGVAQQDRWPDGGARGLTSWMSSTGGATWGKAPDAEWSACQGGPSRFGRVTDPWVSYDKAGNLYFIGQPIDSAALGISAISVTTWDGTSWKTPQILIEDSGDRGVFNDKVSITGDPTRAGYAYATWLRGDVPPGQRQSPAADLHSFAYRGQSMISRTTDGGSTWSKPQPMRRSNAFFQGNQIAVGPDGTLYNVAANLFTGAGVQPNNQGIYMGVMRSHDAGAHWTAPAQIAPIQTAQLFVPDDDFPIRAGDYLPDIAVDPTNGDIYVVWSDGLGTPINRVVMAKSSDGGRHWSEPTVVATGGPSVQSYNHAIEVTAEGTVVVLYYDDRNNVMGDGIATTDVWLRHSHDAGQTWDPEQHLHGPFDHYRAPISYFAPDDPRGLFLGDYVGLETILGDDVIAFFASTNSDGADVRSVRVDHP